MQNRLLRICMLLTIFIIELNYHLTVSYGEAFDKRRSVFGGEFGNLFVGKLFVALVAEDGKPTIHVATFGTFG